MVGLMVTAHLQHSGFLDYVLPLDDQGPPLKIFRTLCVPFSPNMSVPGSSLDTMVSQETKLLLKHELSLHQGMDLCTCIMSLPQRSPPYQAYEGPSVRKTAIPQLNLTHHVLSGALMFPPPTEEEAGLAGRE